MTEINTSGEKLSDPFPVIMITLNEVADQAQKEWLKVEDKTEVLRSFCLDAAKTILFNTESIDCVSVIGDLIRHVGTFEDSVFAEGNENRDKLNSNHKSIL